MSDLIPGTPVRNPETRERGIYHGESPAATYKHVVTTPSVGTSTGLDVTSLKNWKTIELDPDGPCFEWVRPPAPEGVSWVRLSDTVITDVRRYAIGETTAADSSEICNLHRVAKELRLLNPEPVPEITAGVWVSFGQHSMYLERTLSDGKFVTWWPIDEHGWGTSCSGLNSTWVAIDPPSNAGELYELLGVTGDQP